jgi:ATP-dependent exoDNAse (exonuclease V) beta subunit
MEAGTPCPEGRVDGEDDAIAIVTIHSSKGLEWPVVILINSATLLRSREQFVHRASDNTPCGTTFWFQRSADSPRLVEDRRRSFFHSLKSASRTGNAATSP